jgi:predicted small metal-binding protein
MQGESLMARELRCADLMSGCNFVAQGKDDSEVMKKAAEHAKSAHKMAAISMEVEKRARAAIRDAGAKPANKNETVGS